MTALRFSVGLILRRTLLTNPWQDERWEPVAIEPESKPSSVAAVRIADDAMGARWRFGGHSIELHPTEAEGYHLNITAPEPKVFDMWRKADAGIEPAAFPVVVTVSYNQAARMLDAGEQVDALALPAALLAWMEPFVAAHYKPEARTKVRRNDPFRDDAQRRGHGARH